MMIKLIKIMSGHLNMATPLGIPIYWPPVNMEFLVLPEPYSYFFILALGAFLKISRWSLINFFTSTTPTLPMETFHIRNESVSPFNSFTLGKWASTLFNMRLHKTTMIRWPIREALCIRRPIRVQL